MPELSVTVWLFEPWNSQSTPSPWARYPLTPENALSITFTYPTSVTAGAFCGGFIHGSAPMSWNAASEAGVESTHQLHVEPSGGPLLNQATPLTSGQVFNVASASVIHSPLWLGSAESSSDPHSATTMGLWW